jgi:hypothetical protein
VIVPPFNVVSLNLSNSNLSFFIILLCFLKVMSESQPTSLPNAKRKRTTMRLEPPSTASGATRSTRIWLEDGNVIIQAQTTQFRVHRGILSRHSRVFKDMFAIPQPELGEPVIEGCPIFRLFDAAQDWENLLTLLYDGSVK